MRSQPIILHGVKTAWFNLVALHQRFVNSYPMKAPIINPQHLARRLRHALIPPAFYGVDMNPLSPAHSYGQTSLLQSSLQSNIMQNLSHRGIVLLAVIWTFTTLSLISVIGHITWAILFKHFRKADLMIVFALIVGILVSGQITWATVREGSRQHQSDFTPHALDLIAKSLLLNEVLWTLVNGLVRANGLLMILRIMSIQPIVKALCLGLLGITATHTIGSILEIFLICRPLRAHWDPVSVNACGNQQISFVVIECIGLALDVALLLLPLPTILRLQVTAERKVLYIIFLDIGAVIVVITALRLKALRLAVSPDFIFAQSYLGLLSGIGAMLAVTLCTAPFFINTGMKIHYAWVGRPWRVISALVRSSGFRSRMSEGWSQV